MELTIERIVCLVGGCIVGAVLYLLFARPIMHRMFERHDRKHPPYMIGYYKTKFFWQK